MLRSVQEAPGSMLRAPTAHHPYAPASVKSPVTTPIPNVSNLHAGHVPAPLSPARVMCGAPPPSNHISLRGLLGSLRAPRQIAKSAAGEQLR